MWWEHLDNIDWICPRKPPCICPIYKGRTCFHRIPGCKQHFKNRILYIYIPISDYILIHVGLKDLTYQGVCVITGKNKHINWRRMISNTYTPLWFIFSVMKCYYGWQAAPNYLKTWCIHMVMESFLKIAIRKMSDERHTYRQP